MELTAAERMDASRKECYFCGQIAGDAARDLIAQLLPDSAYIRRIVLESPAFAVIPSLGPLTDGHTLLCPKAHVRSLASLAGELDTEFDGLRQSLRRRLEQIYGCTVLQFEHGMARDSDRVPCTVEHAHLHFVPLHGVPAEMLRPDLSWRTFDGSLGELRRLVGTQEYLSLRLSEELCLLATGGAGTFESQLMRKVVAGRGSAAAWDWREHPQAAAAHAVWEQVAGRSGVE